MAQNDVGQKLFGKVVVAGFALAIPSFVGLCLFVRCPKLVLASCETGRAPSQFNVGLCYRDGDGVKASNQQAREWLRKAARRGYAQARDVLTRLLQNQ